MPFELELGNKASEILPNLLKQTRHRINGISSDGTDDTRQCYKTIRLK
ncbi:hypothetical protein [Candidatus Enterovibrio altilux]|uniref:Mobile element protein n=1 Tax=Candidatus Enterovibrio altilux TaxID=1927128 RepID=A0A291B8L0_9GAMM|nr:hypothetical protein [Candidatus Enterovibrio luxaltus]ATF09334.1 hypothetical protein BTN50_0826 [Candidatus Enterovibrio luxaltus]